MTEFVYKGEDFEKKVRKQVEFYFSDSNLQTDKFLWKIYEANDGWVELKTILTFGRMRQYRPEEKVIKALKDSDKLILSKNEDMIRRKDPLQEINEINKARKRNSVHIEGFPNEATQEDLEDFFNTKIVENLPKEKCVCSIRRVRNRAKKEFFGVADVEFKTQEDAEFFLNELNISYPQGIVKVEDESVDKKSLLKKMSLLTFQEMRESGKRFGVNDVTKRRNSFNDNRGNKKFKKGAKGKNGDERFNRTRENKERMVKETEGKTDTISEDSSTEGNPSHNSEEIHTSEVKPSAKAEIVSETVNVDN